ncbi:MAG TPA: sugar transferase [Candidatus Saccharimonadales bacterium]|nr:sugar transferase [Candidatus Saccharimonadales bacterium]
MRKRSELIFSLLQLPIDFVAILTAFVAAYALRVKIDARPVAHPLGFMFFLKIFLLIIPVWVILFALSGLYNLSSLRGRLKEISRVFVAVSAGVMFMIVVDFLSKDPLFPSKSVPIYAYGLSLITVIAAREIMRAVQRSLFRKGIGVYQAVLIGSGPIAQKIAESLKSARHSGYKIIGVIDSARGAQKRMTPLRVDSNFQNLLNRLKNKQIDEFIQADSSLEPDEVYEVVEYAANHHLTYRFVPNQLGIFATHSEVGTMAGMPMIGIKPTPLDGWGRIVKRLFDMTASLLGLLVLSPFFLVIAVIIRVTDPGPVLFKHRRLSRVGKEIYVYKFRTMKVRFSKGEFAGKSDIQVFQILGRDNLVEEFKRDQKVRRDPRVSKIGDLLRRSSLDELPQLWNIFKGDISLVGPRPVVQAELEKYGSGRSTLLSLKPGLTGLWQVSGRNDVSYEERVKLDLFYIENWSLWLDIRIILRTLLILVTRRGAY